jgi:uncharacterized repeat protein (TIGR01451 family)
MATVLAVALPLASVGSSSPIRVVRAAGAGHAVFDATTDTIQVSGQSVIGTQSTIEAIVRFPSAAHATGTIFNEWTSAAEDKLLRAGITPNHVIQGFHYPNAIDSATAPGLTTNTWHHIAIVYDGSAQRIYLDGVQKRSVARNLNVGDGAGLAHIGAIFRDGSINSSFLGHIDTLRHSSVARYSGTSFSPPTGDLASDASTVLLYNFNEEPGSTTVTDESPLGRHGTLGAGFTGATSPTFSSAAVPTLSISDATQFEGTDDAPTENPTPFVFEVSLSEPSLDTVSVYVQTADGTAESADDYEERFDGVIFESGTMTQEVVIWVYPDGDEEPDETFTVNLESPENATIADGEGLGTILNDDGPSVPDATISIDDVSALEGDEGTTDFPFNVELSEPYPYSVIVDYETEDGTATGDGADYVSTTGFVLFEPGETSQTIEVSVIGDEDVEEDETFFVNISTESGLTVADGQGIGTILNDDVPAGVDLGIEKVDQPDPVTAGQTLRYTLTASNLSDADATEVVVTDTLPAGASFQAASSSQGSCSHVSGEVTCALGTLGGGQHASIVIDVLAPSPAPTEPIVNEAAISGAEPDPESENNTVTAETTVLNPATGSDVAAGFADGEGETTVATQGGDGVQFSVVVVPDGVSGVVTMLEVDETLCSAPSGTTCVGERLDLTAPDASPSNPLELRFYIDERELTGRLKAPGGLTIFHTPDEGSQVEVPPCQSRKATTASPAPSCRLPVVKNVRIGGVRYTLLVVLTAENGSWRPTFRN